MSGLSAHWLVGGNLAGVQVVHASVARVTGAVRPSLLLAKGANRRFALCLG